MRIDQISKTAFRSLRLLARSYFRARNHLVAPLGRRLASRIFKWIRVPVFEWIGVTPDAIPHFLRLGEMRYQQHKGQQFLQKDKPKQAALAFQKAIKYSKGYYELKALAVCLQHGLGRMREAIDLFRQSNRLRRDRFESFARTDPHSESDKYPVLDGFWYAAIGHTAQIDYLIKLALLKERDPKDIILYLPPAARPANSFLLDQWRPYIQFVTDPRKLPLPVQHIEYRELDFYVPDIDGCAGQYMWEVAADTNRRWAAQSRNPLLDLQADLKERGRRALSSVGVPLDAWFVGLHVREAGFHSHHRELHNVNNAKIVDYMPAVEEIIKRGGWIIRLGDPTMTPLPPMPNVLDYCHSSIRSDWMDVFLSASCRFFLGSASGLCYVPQAYGVPCVLANWWSPAQRPWHVQDVFIPKRLIRNGKALSLEETLQEPFGYCNSLSYLKEEQNVVVVDNQPEDVRDAVVEMLDRLDGIPNYDANDLTMRDRAESIYVSTAERLYNSKGGFGAAAITRDFLRRNPDFLLSCCSHSVCR